jgi:hypothetical protein
MSMLMPYVSYCGFIHKSYDEQWITEKTKNW